MPPAGLPGLEVSGESLRLAKEAGSLELPVYERFAVAKRSRPNDPRIPETLKHLRILARRHSRRIVIQDYLTYRAKHAPHLPSPSTLYRLFGSWKEALAEAGVNGDSSGELSRMPDEVLIAALKEAAEALGTKTLSSHSYDAYRRRVKSNEGRDLPSSSVIRKWLGPWGKAVKRAGLETTERAAPRRATMDEVIEALRKAKKNIEGMMTPRAYNEFRESLDNEQREEFPDVGQVMQHFPNWETALRAADVEQSDALHPTGLWTAEEARRIARQVEKFTGAKLTRKSYEEVRAKARKPMPEWAVLRDLLAL